MSEIKVTENTYDPISGTWVNAEGHTDKGDPRNQMVPVPAPDPTAKSTKATYQSVQADTKKSK